MYKRALRRVCVIGRIAVRKDAPPARLSRGFEPLLCGIASQTKETHTNAKKQTCPTDSSKKQRTTNNEHTCHSCIEATELSRGLGTQDDRNVFLISISTLTLILIAKEKVHPKKGAKIIAKGNWLYYSTPNGAVKIGDIGAELSMYDPDGAIRDMRPI